MTFKKQTTQKPEPKTPAFYAYIVKDGKDEDQPGFWMKIGAAFLHDDGEGLTVLLDALPPTGRVVLRTPSTKDEA